MQFSDFSLHAQLQSAIRKAGFAKPTPIQERAIPVGLAGHDLIGTAQTGTGKTAAFVLPILQRLLTDPGKLGRTRALIVTPTRELAEQINTTIRRFTAGTSIRSATVYGGVGMQPQDRALRTGVEIIVACPGRLLDHIDRGAASLNGVEMLVLDEADRMLDMGFLPSVKRILSYIPRQRQTMLFSATFAPELQQLAADSLRNPKRVDVATSAPTKTVAHALYPVAQHLKTKLLLKLLSTTDTNSVLIFTRTKHRANRVAEQIGRAGYNTAVLHSNKSQNQRQLALDNFRSGKVQILVATDIAARGIDVATISHVINYDIPDTADTYIHRIGRTGRAEREGDAMTLVTGEDTAMVRDIERVLKAPIERRTLPDFDYSAPAPVLNEFQREPRGQQRGGQPTGRNARPQGAPQPQRRAAESAPRRAPQRDSQRPSSTGNNGARRPSRSAPGR
ncbi:MAG TPA: DEAD/DEAH box helicase [Herpetosiphonaceae bacterium]